MELGVETGFRSYSSPFDYSCSSESPGMSSFGTSSSGSRLFQLSPDMLSSIWTSETKDLHTAKPTTGNSPSTTETTPKETLVSSSPPSSAGGIDSEEKSIQYPQNNNNSHSGSGTGRESSSPLSGSTGTTSSSSASSSLEISALELGNSLFGDSVWSSKGSFNDLGTFGSNDEEKRYLAEGFKNYLKPPASAPGSGGWGSFWSDLSPSLSPTNSETNLQHFGSPALHNPFSTWNAATVNRRSAPPNSSPFSSGSISPISRKQLSPGAPAMGSASPNNVQQQHYRQHYQQQHYRQYRRSASHPVNAHAGNQHHPSNNHHGPSPNGQMGMVGGYNLDSGASMYNTQNQDNVFATGGWNMEAATNGYHQVGYYIICRKLTIFGTHISWSNFLMTA